MGYDDYRYGRPYPKVVIWSAAVAAPLLFALTAVIAFVWTPVIVESQSCDQGIGALAIIGAFVTGFGGFVVVVVGATRAFAARSWPSALIPVAGVALFLVGIALGYLNSQGWGEGCRD